ncbi:MAG TPA: SGNH/GDSL hydrolase family protein [Candidatus Dormibacteraeota bacterium]|nr:SGNH/GDSL hydrolase family protein [Candidatus Dormibacteraeota bacterium]
MTLRSSISLASAALLAVALSACGGGGAGSSYAPPTVSRPSSAATIVGLGDSLTAGMQSGALLGAPVPVTGSLFPALPPTQENGWWALLWSQANGGAPTTQAPLPLIGPAAPLGQMEIPGPAVGSFIAYPAQLCSGAGSQSNALAFAAGSALQTRVNPTAVPDDLGIPGAMAHEALYMTQPYQSSCTIPATTNPQQAQLNALAELLGSESLNFDPILGNFPGKTMVQAAVSLHPTLATVWFGENEVLKFVGSVGQVQPTTPQQFQGDILSIIQQLQTAGAKVAVANLLDPLKAPLFIPNAALPTVLETQYGVPAAAATAVEAFLQSTYAVGPNGYVTLSGLPKILAAIQGGSTSPQLGGGDFVPDAVAAAAEQQLTAYNAAISTDAQATGAALVDINGTFAQLFTAGGVAISAHCCTTQFGGGLFSFDGLHPSNTAYALVANVWIQAVDTKFGLTIPPLTSAQIAQISASDPYVP